MHVASDQDREVQFTLEFTLDFVNQLAAEEHDRTESTESTGRQILIDYGFTRAPEAPADQVALVVDRIHQLDPLLRAMPSLSTDEAIQSLNQRLGDLQLEPSITDHDGAGWHLHWTAPSASFSDQVMADVLMALSQELVEDGVSRFGICTAEECVNLFYDSTRNRSRKFCSDARCASRTHTASHRARKTAK